MSKFIDTDKTREEPIRFQSVPLVPPPDPPLHIACSLISIIQIIWNTQTTHCTVNTVVLVQIKRAC